MKKILVLCLGVLVSLSVFAASDSTKVKGAKDGLAHWSFGIRGGGNYFRLESKDIASGYENNISWTAGADVVYDVNQWFGVGVNLDWSSYKRKGVVTGGVAEGDVFTTLNWTNIVAPYRQNNWKKFNFYTHIGMGAADGISKDYLLYNSSSTYGGLVVGHRDSWYGAWTPYTRFALRAEVSACKWLGVFFDAAYKLYWRRWAGGMLTHEYMFTDNLEIAAGLRFRFASNGKTHIRNTTPERPGVIEAPSSSSELDALRNQLAALQAKQDSLEKARPVVPQYDNTDLAQKVAELQKKQAQQDVINANVQAQLSALQKKIGEAIQTGGTVSLPGVNFTFASAELTGDSYKILDEAAATLRDYTGWKKVYVVGHTDNCGTDAYNQNLSMMRAKSVMNYLIKMGVPAGKISYKGYGASRPIDTNLTKEGRAHNRRVELSFSEPD